MLERSRYLLLVVGLLLIVLVGVQVSAAQDNTAVCANLAVQALTQIGVNCANRVPGTVCYGSPNVEALLQATSPTALNAPRDRVLFTDLIHVRLSPVDFASETWGMVTLSFPTVDPQDGDAAGVGIAMGGMEIEPDEPISSDPAAPPPFFLRTGIGGIPCPKNPSFLGIQSPRDRAIEITVNEVSLRIVGSIVLKTFPAGEPVGQQMLIIGLSGVTEVTSGDAAGSVIPPGFVLPVLLDPDLVSLGVEGDVDERSIKEFEDLRLLTRDELEELGILEQIPDNLTDEPFDLPEIITPSSTTAITTQVIFSNPQAAAQALELCASGDLPEEVCQVYGN